MEHGGTNKKDLTMKNVRSQSEKIKRLISIHIKFSIILKFSKLKFKKLLHKLEKKLSSNY